MGHRLPPPALTVVAVLMTVGACSSESKDSAGAYELGSGRAGDRPWEAVAFKREGQDCVELRFDRGDVSGTCDFRLTEAGRKPAEFNVSRKGGDLFVFGAVADDIVELTVISQEGGRSNVQPIPADRAGTRVPVFLAVLPGASHLTSIQGNRSDGTVVTLDPGPPVPSPRG